MSEQTEFKKAQNQAAVLGGTAWIEELLIRGRPDGSIKGSHLVIGIQAPDMTPVLKGPFPLGSIEECPEWEGVTNAINTAAVDQVALLTHEVALLQQQLSQLQQPVEQEV